MKNTSVSRCEQIIKKHKIQVLDLKARLVLLEVKLR